MIIDVSRYNRVIDFKKATAAGVTEVISRIGVGFDADPFYARNYLRAQDELLKVASYYVPNWTYDRTMQLEAMAAMLDGVGWKQDSMVWIDCEVANGYSGNTLRSAILSFMQAANALLGPTVGIYTGRWWWDPNVGLTSWAQDYPLWTASYTATPLIPKGWTKYALWQYSETGKIDGIPGSTDLNRRP